MKRFITIATALMASMSVSLCQQVESFTTGTYSNYFTSSPSPEFSMISGSGIEGTWAISPLKADFLINYLLIGPFSMFSSNATLTMSTFFQISTPTQTEAEADTVQIGFTESQAATSFFAPSPTNSIFAEISCQEIEPVSGGYVFTSSIATENPNAGWGWGADEGFILYQGHWYEYTFEIKRSGTTNLDLYTEIDDYGSYGTNLVSVVNTFDTGVVTGSYSPVVPTVATNQTLFPAITGMSTGGLYLADNISITGNLSPAISIGTQLDIQVSFTAQSGHTYYIESSSNLNQWTVVQEYSGSGNAALYYPVNQTAQYFRVVEK